MVLMTNLWVEACEELWILATKRPGIREATLWDAFRFLYMSRVNSPTKVGRKNLGEV